MILPQELINVLGRQSGPGGLHENTFLLVMGDHGQTLNGDHGGGSAEEIRTFRAKVEIDSLRWVCRGALLNKLRSPAVPEGR